MNGEQTRFSRQTHNVFRMLIYQHTQPAYFVWLCAWKNPLQRIQTWSWFSLHTYGRDAALLDVFAQSLKFDESILMGPVVSWSFGKCCWMSAGLSSPLRRTRSLFSDLWSTTFKTTRRSILTHGKSAPTLSSSRPEVTLLLSSWDDPVVIVLRWPCCYRPEVTLLLLSWGDPVVIVLRWPCCYRPEVTLLLSSWDDLVVVVLRWPCCYRPEVTLLLSSWGNPVIIIPSWPFIIVMRWSCCCPEVTLLLSSWADPIVNVLSWPYCCRPELILLLPSSWGDPVIVLR